MGWRSVYNFLPAARIVGVAALILLCCGAARADGLSVSAGQPQAQNLSRTEQSGKLRLVTSTDLRAKVSRNPVQPSGLNLFLITNASCPAPLHRQAVPGLPAVGGSGKQGDWVLFVGLNWNDQNAPGLKSPVLDASAEDERADNWYYNLEMIFIPRDNWHVHAKLSFDTMDIRDALGLSSSNKAPLQLGLDVIFDYDHRNQVALGLGYGRSPLDAHPANFGPGEAEPPRLQPGENGSRPEVISACLNIQF